MNFNNQVLASASLVAGIVDDPRKADGYGICHAVRPDGLRHALPLRNLLREAFSTWENFSGDDIYPVPNPRRACSREPADIYHRAFEEDALYEGDYGVLRLDLARHVVKYFREYVMSDMSDEVS